MPKNSIDYSKTIIYKICCKDPTITDIYVGHTTNLVKRRCQHKTRCCNPKDKKNNYYVYETIRKYGGWDNWEFVVIEECNVESMQQAKLKERYWVEALKATLNKKVPLRTKKEWYEDNKEHMIEYHQQYSKEWNEKNKENIKLKRKLYYEMNKEMVECDCGYILLKKCFNRHLETKLHKEFIIWQNS